MPLSPSSLPFIRSLSSLSAMRFSKTNQWQFKQWKLIKELNLEHLKSLCYVQFFLIWLFFDLMVKYNKIFRAWLPVSNIGNNNCLPEIIAFPQIIVLLLWEKEIIAPSFYSRKYSIFEVKLIMPPNNNIFWFNWHWGCNYSLIIFL